MKIHFHLSWADASHAKNLLKSFKSRPAAEIFADYLSRISAFVPSSVSGRMDPLAKKPGDLVWICHRGKASRALSSEDLAGLLERGTPGSRELHSIVGPPDGFSPAEIDGYKPDLLWSFGPLTLPHELAALIAAEQIYRAWTILRHLPYHSGH